MREVTLDELLLRDYPVVIIPMKDEDEEYYYAYLPDFGCSACSATGETISEVIENLQKVKEDILTLYLSTDKDIPEEWSSVLIGGTIKMPVF